MSIPVLINKDPLTQKVCVVCSNPTDAEMSSYDGEDKVVCDDCDEYFEWCEICQTRNHSEYSTPCRHLFWDDEVGVFRGFGTYKNDWQKGKNPFLAMLGMAGVEFAIDLRRSLLAHKYYFQFRGSIFGAESIEYQLLKESGKMSWEYKGCLDRVFEEKDPEKQELIATGINWLMSLWAGCDDDWDSPETKESDLVAAEWCNEFLDAQGEKSY
jgi:hypothetical protein